MDLTVRPTDIFNAVGAASQEVMRQLLYAAETGNENVLTPFSAPDGVGDGPKARARRERDDRDFEQLMEFALASQEQMEEFERKLDRLDRASAEALAENETQLREAKEALKRIRDRAYEVRMPDGSRVKVYRDGNAVRNDDGAFVNPQVVKPAEIPATAPTWAERKTAGDTVSGLEATHRKLVKFHNDVEHAQDRLKNGDISESELDDLDKKLEREMPDDVRRRYDQLTARSPDAPSLDGRRTAAEPPTFHSDFRPTDSFTTAAAGAGPDSVRGPEFTPPAPAASVPAPK